MSRQKNIPQQNAEVTAEIERVASAFENRHPSVSWLWAELESRGLSPQDGILVTMQSVMEQGGDYFKALWLSKSQDFWEFEAMVPREAGRTACVERFENVTSSVIVSAHERGIGKSLGYLALEVLKKRLGA